MRSLVPFFLISKQESQKAIAYKRGTEEVSDAVYELAVDTLLLFNVAVMPQLGVAMRLFIATLLLAVLSLGLWETARSVSWFHGTANSVAIYDPNSSHLWNQLHAVLFIRPDVPGTESVPDSLDPPLWYHTDYLLAKPSHERVLRILDEFLQTHAERLIQDPVKSAMLQRELWAVFDWTVERSRDRVGEPAYDKERQELQTRLAELLRRLALTPEQIHALPSNYEQAVASGQFAKEYDPQHRDRPFLPPDLFDPRGPWIQLSTQSAGFGPAPTAPSHAHTFSRSSFLVFLRLPDGRKATFDYLRTVWDFPQPWIPRPDNGNPERDQTVENPNLPQFPAGTQVALVRQMMLFDSRGNLQGTPITESVQLRVYRAITGTQGPISESDLSHASEKSGQDFYEIRLSRPQLFANKTGGLRAIGLHEREFSVFGFFPADEGARNQRTRLDQYPPILETCFQCHRGAGINSLNSRGRLLKPNWLQHDFPAGASDPEYKWWEAYQDAGWKQNHYEWGLLNGYWRSSAATSALAQQ